MSFRDGKQDPVRKHMDECNKLEASLQNALKEYDGNYCGQRDIQANAIGAVVTAISSSSDNHNNRLAEHVGTAASEMSTSRPQ